MAMIRARLDKVESYQLEASAKLTWPGGLDSSIACQSRIWGRIPNRLGIEARITSTQQGNRVKEATVKVIYDGTWLWIQQQVFMQGKPLSLSVQKLNLAGFVTKSQPYNTPFVLTGTGLLPKEDYVSTVRLLLRMYRLGQPATLKVDGQPCWVYSGKLVEKRLRKYLHEMGQGQGEEMLKMAIEQARTIRIHFSKADRLCRGYAVGPAGKESDLPTLTTRFTKLRVDGQLPANAFRYILPKGATVVDITARMKARRGQEKGSKK